MVCYRVIPSIFACLLFGQKDRVQAEFGKIGIFFKNSFHHNISLQNIKGGFSMYSLFSEYKDIVTIEELQEMLRIGRSKAYQLLRSGQIKAMHDGRVWLIPKKSVIEYVVGRCG